MQKRGVFFLVSIILFVVFVFNAQAAHPPPCNAGEVQIGEWCYDCEKSGDDVCPNDFIPDTCSGDNWDYDCVPRFCTERVNAADECTSQGSPTGACEWGGECSGKKIASGGESCYEFGTLTYSCVQNQCGAECSDGQTGSQTSINGGNCEKQNWACSNTCTKNYGGWYGADDCSYQNSCDPGSGSNQCGQSCSRTINLPHTSSGNEASVSCTDGVDNDCDGESDYDSMDGNHGDNNCAVSISSISVSDSTPAKGQNFEIICSVSVANVNSVDAFVENQLCNYLSWNGNDVRFVCSTSNLNVGNNVAKCTINSGKSYQSGSDKTSNVNVIQGQCSSYGSSNSCNSDPDDRCEWCLECSGNSYSGGNNRCVDKGSCSYTVQKNFCGAECDATVGGCGTTICDGNDGCYSGTYRDYQTVNEQCDVNGQCQAGSCNAYNEIITDNDGDGYDTECDGECKDADPNIHPGMSESCNGVDDNCDSQIDEGLNFQDYYVDNDGDGYGVGSPSNLCASPGSGYATQPGDCNDNNVNVNPSKSDICNGVNDDCNLNTLDGSGENAPLNDKQLGICSGTSKSCNSGQWVNNYPAEYEANNELTCNDNNLDNDCDGVANCQDSDCGGIQGPNGLVCCSVKEDCPADGSQAFVGCLNDNVRTGSQQTYSCSQGNECIATNNELQDSCNTGCCLPGQQGGSVCVNSDQSSVMDVDSDSKFELCYVPVDVGDWKGANCSGNNCVDDPEEGSSYECIVDSDCASMNAGECGEAICLNNECVTQAKSDAEDVCNSIGQSNGYECAYYISCSNNIGTEWECQFGGESSLCGDPNDPSTYDLACSGNPDYKCDVDLCANAGENSCSLCYSECVEAANDPNRSPSSEQECPKNGQWTQCGG